jgi:4-amino-4-deoxy-L-arabinose transferase
MGAFMPLLVYRIAKLITENRRTAFLSALFMVFNFYHLELIAGTIGMDQNDVSFGFYILMSIWTYLEYLESGRIYFALLAGIFSGAAILNKWLVGLLVYLPWMIDVIQQVWRAKSIKPLIIFIIAFVTTLLTVLPWQIYILTNFRSIALYEYSYNSRHVWEVLEGHAGNWYFYLRRFPDYFGDAGSILLGLGLFLSLYKNHLKARPRNNLLICIFAVLIFFSFIAKTKLPSYVFIIVPICFVFMADALNWIIEKIRFKWAKALVICLVILQAWRPGLSYEQRLDSERARKISNTKIYKSLNKHLPQGYKTVVNLNSFEDVECMFYNPEINAYSWWIDTGELSNLQKKGIKIAAFVNHGVYELPAPYQAYPDLFWIRDTLK